MASDQQSIEKAILNDGISSSSEVVALANRMAQALSIGTGVPHVTIYNATDNHSNSTNYWINRKLEQEQFERGMFEKSKAIQLQPEKYNRFLIKFSHKNNILHYHYCCVEMEMTEKNIVQLFQDLEIENCQSVDIKLHFDSNQSFALFSKIMAINSNKFRITHLDLTNRKFESCDLVFAQAVCDILSNMNYLRVLRFTTCFRDMAANTLPRISNAIMTNKNLKGFFLYDSYISTDDYHDLLKAVLKNKFLTALGFEQVQLVASFPHHGFSKLDPIPLAEALEVNPDNLISELRFSHITERSNISSSEMTSLVNVLQKKRTPVTALDLSHNNGSGEAGHKALAEFISSNQQLLRLNLQRFLLWPENEETCQVDKRPDEGLPIFNSLIMSQSLRYVGLFYDGLWPEDLDALLKFFARSQSIQEIEFDGVGRDINCQPFLTLVKSNINIINLKFQARFGGSKNEIIEQIDSQLKSNQSRFDARQREALLMGFHARLGKDSALSKMSKNSIFEPKVVELLFEFSGIKKGTLKPTHKIDQHDTVDASNKTATDMTKEQVNTQEEASSQEKSKCIVS